MNSPTEREKFEAWADVKYPLVNKLRQGDPLRGYSANMKACAWDGWQARASQGDALYRAVNEMMAPLGYHGTICARDDRVQAVMDALHAIDGGTVQGDADAKDAARYRWLRLRAYKDGGDICCNGPFGSYDQFGGGFLPESLDAAIDCAISAAMKEPHHD